MNFHVIVLYATAILVLSVLYCTNTFSYKTKTICKKCRKLNFPNVII